MLPFYFMYMGILPAYVCTACMQKPVEATRDHEIPGAGDNGRCEPPSEFWEPNPGL